MCLDVGKFQSMQGAKAKIKDGPRNNLYKFNIYKKTKIIKFNKDFFKN